jgi:hypothetical protein
MSTLKLIPLQPPIYFVKPQLARHSFIISHDSSVIVICITCIIRIIWPLWSHQHFLLRRRPQPEVRDATSNH